MAITQEMFRFVTTRRPERVLLHRINNKLIRDLRPLKDESLLAVLFGPGSYETKLDKASNFVKTEAFVDADDPAMLALEPAVDFFRAKLVPGVVLADLAAEFEAELPQYGALIKQAPAKDIIIATILFIARLFDSIYALTIIGFNQYTSTNYLTDGLRVYHVLRLLWLRLKHNQETWSGGNFNAYEVLIDIDKARKGLLRTAAGDAGDSPSSTPERELSLSGKTGLLAGSGSTFRVQLSVGEIMPPTVGDLILVEQDLRRYELGELASIDSIMKGERRERTIRKLSRTIQTTTTESFSELEETSSLSTDERFQLSSEAQETASKNFSIQTGVNISAKYGPVQIGASVNASFDTSQSSSHSTAQEYAKTVTEEAAKRVKNSFKETSSVTILTETQDTTLRGFNNEAGANHINGLGRWVDKIYEARLLNYGRRLMMTFNVPEPSAFYLSHLLQNETKLMENVVAPVPPSRVSTSTGDPLPEDSLLVGFTGYRDISENNYAKFAALYDVKVDPPPPEEITGAKAIAYPEAMEAAKVEAHSSEGKELSYVGADNTLSIDPGYKLTNVGVFAPKGNLNTFGNYADTLKLGEGNDTNRIMVEVGDRHFYFSAVGEGGGDRRITTNFNDMQAIHPSEDLAGVLQNPLPIHILADFEGILALNIIYTASRRSETFDQWKSDTYAAIINGYNNKKNAYEQALAVAEAKVQSDTEAQTYQLRDDQYRSIELMELKRGCIDLLSQGTAAGYTSIDVEDDGTPRIIYDGTQGSALGNWRKPLANGAVAEFFETAFDWDQSTYTFYPYYWAGSQRWKDLSQVSGADPIFEKFLRAGNANFVVPVRPGYERSVILFLKIGRIWAGGYLSLFTSQDMLDVYADVELGELFDPPEQIGDSWEIRMPTSMVMLQEDDKLPEFPPAESGDVSMSAGREPVLDDSVPY